MNRITRVRLNVRKSDCSLEFGWDGDDDNDGDGNGHGHSNGAAGVGPEAETDTENYVDGGHGGQ